MGDFLVSLFRATFNHSVRVNVSDLELTEDVGALLLREASKRTGLDRLLAELPDSRDPDQVCYSLPELLRTRILMLAQGWQDQGDAKLLRHDAAFRVSIADRSGDAPLKDDFRLPSQPTLWRMQHALASKEGTAALNQVLLQQALQRIRRADPNRRWLTLDLDTTHAEVYGHQDGATYNSHYGCVCFQPLLVYADTGDLLAIHLRPGGNPTAEESFAFMKPVLEEARKLGFSICLRMDAGFSNAHMMRECDEMRVRFITRLKTTNALERQTEAWYQRTLAAWRASPVKDGEPRTETYELWDKPSKNGRIRRIVAVAVEPEVGELFSRRFFLCTNFARPEHGSAAILAHYRKRGTAEVYIGEYKNNLLPSLRAVPRGKKLGTVTILDNNVTALLAALAYNLMHALRLGVELKTDEGWSLGRLRERLLKAATQVVRHARQIEFRISKGKAVLWAALEYVICDVAAVTGEVAR